MPLRIKSHIVYPPREVKSEPEIVVRLPAKLNARIDAAILRGVSTKEIRATMDVTNEDVQRRRHQMRRRGLIKAVDDDKSGALA